MARADDTNSPPPMQPQDYFEGGTNAYTDWIALSAGGFLAGGDQDQAQQIQHWRQGGFGGIEDLHLQGNVNTNVVYTLDGNTIYDQNDYDLKLRLEYPQKWYLQFKMDNYRSWSDNIGGFYPPTGTLYSAPNEALALDRGDFSFEAGVTPAKLPALTFKYTRSYRDGDKDSTIWGPVNPNLPNAEVQGLAPSFYDLNETVDAFDLDAKKTVKGTDLDAGLHYEHGVLNDGLDQEFYPGEPTGSDVTQQEKDDYDMFSAHASSETWIKPNLMLSAGGMFANMDDNFSGSQIYGDGFNAPYTPGPYNGVGYYDLTGNSHMADYVADLDLLAIPVKTFTIVPSIRAQKETTAADSSGTGTDSSYDYESATGPFMGQSSQDQIDVTEALDLRYTGITNWVFSARGEWNEGQGNVNETGGITPTNGFLYSSLGAPATPITEYFAVNNLTDDSRWFQKYSVNARWYPLYRLVINAGGYYQNDKYNYSFPVDSTPNNAGLYNNLYPGFLAMQRFQTYDGNLRVTWHPFSTVTLTPRYEFQYSTVDTAPDNSSGLFPEVQAATMTTHIVGTDVGWIPWSRLDFQAGFDYVLSETKTPASDYTEAVLNSENNYWTLNFGSSFIVSDKTTFNVDYFYYQADDYVNNASTIVNNASAGEPYGAGSREHAVTATLTRQMNPHWRVSLKYGYYNYNDALTGGNSNFQAQLVMATMQYRF